MQGMSEHKSSRNVTQTFPTLQFELHYKSGLKVTDFVERE